jgi:hypothetical protein
MCSVWICTPRERHLAIHIGLYHPSMVSCSVCGQMCNNSTSLRVHIFRKHRTCQERAPTIFTDNQPPLLTGLPVINSNSSPSLFGTASLRNRKLSLDELTLMYLKYAGEKAMPETSVREFILELSSFVADGDGYYENVFSSTKQFDRHMRQTRLPYVPPIDHCTPRDNRGIAYVPFENNLKSLLETNGVMDEVLAMNHYFRSQVEANNFESISDIVHGEYFRQYDDSILQGTTIFIMLYSDEYGICNALGAKASKHKTFALYFTIANIRWELRSQLPHGEESCISCQETY